MAEEVTANVISELISDLTIHITTYDTCVYVDKSVDFVDYSGFYTEKTTDGSKMVYNSKRTVVEKKSNGTEVVNKVKNTSPGSLWNDLQAEWEKTSGKL